MTNIHHRFVSLAQEVPAQIEARAKIEETL